MLIKKFLNDRYIRAGTIRRTSHIESKFKSFSIVILRDDLNKVLINNFWPEGVKCRLWRDKNKNISYMRSRTFSNSLNGRKETAPF